MNIDTEFARFLLHKKIDIGFFRSDLNQEFQQLEQEFVAIGPSSFDQQKKFLLNNLRLQYPLQGETVLNPASPSKTKVKKPMMKQKPKMG